MIQFLIHLITSKNNIRYEIKKWLQAGKACNYSLNTLLSSRLLSRNGKIRNYRIHNSYPSSSIIWMWKVVSTLQDENTFREFENKILMQKFVDLSNKFKFGHINVDKANKISFSYNDGLSEQYVRTFNDSLKDIYLNFTLHNVGLSFF